MKILFKIMVWLSSICMNAYAVAGCTEGYQILMSSSVGNIQLSGDIKKNDLLATIDGFVNMYGNHNTIECTDNSTVYLMIQRTPGGGAIAYDGGIPNAYYHSRSANPNSTSYNPENDYVYTVSLEDDGTPFVVSGTPYPVSATKDFKPRVVIRVYAGQDNPSTNVSFTANNYELWAHMATVPVSWNNPGRTYTVSGRISAPKALCTLDNSSKNMTMILPPKPSSEFTQIGDVSGAVDQQISLTCTGDATATMKLTNTQLLSDGRRHTVIVPETKKPNQAEGIGFVLSHEGQRVANDDSIDIQTQIRNGTVSIPIRAEYFRYGNQIKAGNLEAYANLTITFQ